MRRLLKLKTPWLALVLSIGAEIAFCLVAFIAGRLGQPGEPVLFSRVWGGFHDPPELFSEWCIRQVRWHDITSAGPEITRSAIFLLSAVLQWYALLFLAIVVYRRFARKTV